MAYKDVYLNIRSRSVHVNRTDRQKVVNDFIHTIKYGIEKGIDEFIIEIDCHSSAYPNVCVPIAGILQYLKKDGMKFVFKTLPDFLANTNIHEPLESQISTISFITSPINKIWSFNSADAITLLIDRMIREVSLSAECQKGVIEGLTWCLNEVMDNVLVHSNADKGFIMGQIHPIQKHIAFCIFDYGQGIFNSLKDSIHHPRYPLDAITLCIKEGITRDKSIYQGNGLWGLHNMLKSNSGRLSIASDKAYYLLSGNRIETYTNNYIFEPEDGFTTIDFQIDYGRGISIEESLGGHKPVNYGYESMENEGGQIVYKIKDKSSGTGTRQSGERLRNEVINIHNETNRIILIDFEGISVISSSFSDEFVGKLVIKYGFYGFIQAFRLKNMNEIVQTVLNRSVSQRMAENFG